jgi:peptidoglycan/LPS O-acetylase OafA/YrhL
VRTTSLKSTSTLLPPDATGTCGQVAAPTFFVPLESLRGLAALVVVVLHAEWSNPVTSLQLFRNGGLMVDFFFVLSGFVVFHAYGRRLGTSREIARFLWLRIGRLYPLHLALLLVFVAFEIAKFVAVEQFGLVAAKPPFAVNDAFSFASNLLLIHSLGLHGNLTYNYPSWSISTEFYAYALFAVSRSLWPRDLRYTIVAALIVILAAATLFLVDVVALTKADHDWGFFRCCAGFMIGTLTYIAYCRIRTQRFRNAVAGWLPWLSPATLVTMIVFLSSVDVESRWTYVFPLLAALAILSIVLWPLQSLQRLLSIGPLRWLGRVSYSVYMVHAAVAWLIYQALTVIGRFPAPDGISTPPGVGFSVLVGYIGVVLVLSHCTFRWIEKPFRERSRRAAERWFPREAAAAVPRS